MSKLVRNDSDRELINTIRDARFIASHDLYLLSDRSYQETSAALTRLRRDKHIPIVGSVGRIVGDKTYYASKTYIYGDGKRGHLQHWLALSHVHGLVVDGARTLQVPFRWTQHQKHYEHVPDAILELPGASWRIEVDRSTERKSTNGSILTKDLESSTLIFAFGGEERFRTLCGLSGLKTWHGAWHEDEGDDNWNILTSRIFWDGRRYRGLLES